MLHHLQMIKAANDTADGRYRAIQEREVLLIGETRDADGDSNH